MDRFRHRWICVTETHYVTKPPSFRYRSYGRYGDASFAVDTVNRSKNVFKRAYLVDRDKSQHIILP
jgi:hypothetical protein